MGVACRGQPVPACFQGDAMILNAFAGPLAFLALLVLVGVIVWVGEQVRWPQRMARRLSNGSARG